MINRVKTYEDEMEFLDKGKSKMYNIAYQNCKMKSISIYKLKKDSQILN